MLDVGINVLPPAQQQDEHHAAAAGNSDASQNHGSTACEQSSRRDEHAQARRGMSSSSGGGGGRLVGDTAFAEVARVAAAVTPVPGGIGPMTIAALVHNVILAARYSAGLPWASISRPVGGEAKAVARASR